MSEEDEKLKNTSIIYYSRDTPVDEYKRFIRYVYNIWDYGIESTIKSNNIEDEIKKLIEKGQRFGFSVGKEQIVRPILDKEIPLIPDKYKNLIDIDYRGVNLKHDSLKNKIIFFIKMHDILKKLKENERKRAQREGELYKLSIEELIQLAKKDNINLNKIVYLIVDKIIRVYECVNDPYAVPGQTC